MAGTVIGVLLTPAASPRGRKTSRFLWTLRSPLWFPDDARGPTAYGDPQNATGTPQAMGTPSPKLTSGPKCSLPPSASSTELTVTLLACERYYLVPASGPGPSPRRLPSLECGDHVMCYLSWYPHRSPKGAMPNVAWQVFAEGANELMREKK